MTKAPPESDWSTDSGSVADSGSAAESAVEEAPAAAAPAEPRKTVEKEAPADEAPAERGKAGSAAENGSPTVEGVSTHATNDNWTVEDQLGYLEYARSIRHFLTDSRTSPPLTISIQAPWGGGKTSLMRMIQHELDPGGFERQQASPPGSSRSELAAKTEDLLAALDLAREGKEEVLRIGEEDQKCVSVWFNAWKYESTNQIWAGLAEAVIRQLADRLTAVEREKFFLKLHLSRIDVSTVRRRVYDVAFRRFLGIGRWVLLAGTSIVLGLAGYAMTGASSLIGWEIPASILGTLGALAASYRGVLQKVKREPADVNLSEFVDLPDYSKELGFIHQVTEDLGRVFKLLPADEDGRAVPLLIFIDDLDRCSPTRVAEVFEAINLFVAGDFPDCYFVIGMDTEIVAAALEEAHKDVIRRLPAYITRAPIGWRFMDKFVQLPFVIPPLDPQAVADYAEYLAAAEDPALREEQKRAAKLGKVAKKGLEDGKSVEEIVEKLAGEGTIDSEYGKGIAHKVVEREKRLQFIDKQAGVLKKDKQQIQQLVLNAKEDFSNNPRELKRLVNVYRFYYLLRLARQARGVDVPSEKQLENWVKLSLAWPEVVRWMRRSYSEWETAKEPGPDSTTIGKRLEIMTQAAGKNGSRAAWKSELEQTFDLPAETPWLSDDRLYVFFRDMSPEGDLSTGAGKGFW